MYCAIGVRELLVLKEVREGVDGAGKEDTEEVGTRSPLPGEEDTEEVGHLLAPLGAAHQDGGATLAYREQRCERHSIQQGNIYP